MALLTGCVSVCFAVESYLVPLRFQCVQDINSLDVSPNDKLFVSASQDKTAKVPTSLGQPFHH